MLYFSFQVSLLKTLMRLRGHMKCQGLNLCHLHTWQALDLLYYLSSLLNGIYYIPDLSGIMNYISGKLLPKYND